ncbi:nucleotidyltransferase domain-containing protein [Kribbella jiaozuonensis]|uniref:Nucleotidyltransferase domain-containing protein n=1 Tax=Kribbella jiaozuonensis TaxID=2575441 RepID=A0A4U3M2D3_9ACTN|nr:nucleotidyltransferase domain-containing protein [Kribbella jiaozuonensis]TKK82332.1 nucleotidyltransferase domain-containing protein [Kribbella jiaozuonensis]
MYTPAERSALRDELVARARGDARIAGAALTGSAAVGGEDEWSDIDLALGLGSSAVQDTVLADWTAAMYASHGAIHHTDMWAGPTIYRVFLLPSTLQVDIAFAPAEAFGALGPTFQLLFGEAVEQPSRGAPDPVDLIGMGWLYALHARSSIARGKVWQAEYMISGVRDHVLMLMCLRHGVPHAQGRGLHLLPGATTWAVEPTLVRSLDAAELKRAFRASVDVLLAEMGEVDGELAVRLTRTLRELTA